jgi:anti-sigma regulatory factor (Ser/Thr protein kinase)/anti-anti-sigma regulatory factor
MAAGDDGLPAVGVAALQAALLPATVPILPRIALGARYLLADLDIAAGGDWFDAVVRPDGSLGLVVGDVVGHGVAASATMGQLRAVARHCLESAASPAAVVTGVDRFAGHLDGARTAPRGGPLATGATYAEATAQLAEGDLLLLYTDGIIERPDVHPARGCAEFADVATGAADRRRRLDDLPFPQWVCDQTLAELTRNTGYRDDVTVLAMQRHAPVGEVELTLPNTRLAVPTTRAALGGWLAALQVDEVTADAIQHAVGEAVGNAVEHAYRDRPGDHAVEVRAALTEVGTAEITVADRGRWRAPADDLHRGVGLALASGLVDDVRIDRRPSGTTVRLRHRLGRLVTVSTSSVETPLGLADDEPFLAALTDVDDPDAVLVVRGPIDALGAVELRDQLRSVTGNGTVSRTVDLSRVTLLASAAVHVLHEARHRSIAHREHLHLLAPRGSAAHHVLELVGLPTDPHR